MVNRFFFLEWHLRYYLQVADKKGDVITLWVRQPSPRGERENRITCIFFWFCILND